jgi:hypothetical protein
MSNTNPFQKLSSTAKAFVPKQANSLSPVKDTTMSNPVLSVRNTMKNISHLQLKC